MEHVAEWVLAVATVVLATATFCLVLEGRTSSFRRIGVQTWLHMQARFDSTEMKRARSALARQFKSHDDAKRHEVSETVLDFFEDVGTLYAENYLDGKLAKLTLSFYACRWWEAAIPYVKSERRRHGGDSTLFEDFESFVERRTRQEEDRISEDELRGFLDDEEALGHSGF